MIIPNGVPITNYLDAKGTCFKTEEEAWMNNVSQAYNGTKMSKYMFANVAANVLLNDREFIESFFASVDARTNKG